MSTDALRRDQEDIYQRLLADEYFADVPVLLQRQGVTDSDIEVALSALNEKQSKIGVVAIVLMPEVQAKDPDVPGPLFDVVVIVQVIDQPLFNLGDTGINKPGEEVALRVAQILHHFAPGTGTLWTFAGIEPMGAENGTVMYGVRISRDGGVVEVAKVATPSISPSSGAAPQTVTLICSTAGASIYYTTDGSYPGSQNGNATLYTAPFEVSTAATLRVAAEKAALQQSDIATAIYS